VKTGDVALCHLTHPEGITIDAQGKRAYVAVANADRLAVIDLATRALAENWSTARSDVGASPTALALSPDGSRGAPPGSLSRVDCFRAKFAAHDLGQIVDTISHSPIWSSSAIFVVEDDSQDGADHVDAHRTVAAVISPYAKLGAVIHTRYDQLSIERSIELILGMRPLGLQDALATPMFDAFTSAVVNAAPFTALPENTDLLARNPNTAFNRRMTGGLDFAHLDAVPQHAFDNVLWKYVHGSSSKPPPAGPNAVAGPDAADGDD
jgi:hypothetical protein